MANYVGSLQNFAKSKLFYLYYAGMFATCKSRVWSTIKFDLASTQKLFLFSETRRFRCHLSIVFENNIDGSLGILSGPLASRNALAG